MAAFGLWRSRRLAATSRPAPRSRSPGAPPLASAPSRRRPAAATRPEKWKKVAKGGQEKKPHYESDSSAISSIFASSSGSTSPGSSGFVAMNWAAHRKSSFVRKSVLLVRSARVTRYVRLFICPSPGESRSKKSGFSRVRADLQDVWEMLPCLFKWQRFDGG